MIVANNRFLQRVNPEIVRARADASAIVSKQDETQVLMRQMVDLGIADNLKLWVHSGLVDTRTVGSDVFVPKAYDISSNNNDAVQATTDNQPELVDLGMEFDGVGLFLTAPQDDFNFMHQANAKWTSLSWQKLALTGAHGENNLFYIHITCNLISTNVGALLFIDDRHTITRYRRVSINIFSGVAGSANVLALGSSDNFYPDDGAWHFVAAVVDLTLGHSNGKIYIDAGTPITGNKTTNTPSTAASTSDLHFAQFSAGTRDHKGHVTNDIRIFNSALSAAQITAIFDETKSKYGIT